MSKSRVSLNATPRSSQGRSIRGSVRHRPPSPRLTSPHVWRSSRTEGLQELMSQVSSGESLYHHLHCLWVPITTARRFHLPLGSARLPYAASNNGPGPRRGILVRGFPHPCGQHSMSRCADVLHICETFHGRSYAMEDRPPLRNTITGGRPPGRITSRPQRGGSKTID